MTLLWILLGTTGVLALVFTGLLFVQHFLGFENSLRDEAGQLDASRSRIGQVMFVLVFSLIIGGPVIAIHLVEQRTGPLSFGGMWGLAYAIFFLANLYDLVVLDYFLVVRHRPSFIKGLPDTPYYTTMKPHVQGFARGSGIGAVTSLLSALLAWFVF
jgi:hypothetical protein